MREFPGVGQWSRRCRPRFRSVSSPVDLDSSPRTAKWKSEEPREGALKKLAHDSFLSLFPTPHFLSPDGKKRSVRKTDGSSVFTPIFTRYFEQQSTTISYLYLPLSFIIWNIEFFFFYQTNEFFRDNMLTSFRIRINKFEDLKSEKKEMKLLYGLDLMKNYYSYYR